MAKAEVLITFAREVGCVIDEIQRQKRVRIGESTYMTASRTKVNGF